MGKRERKTWAPVGLEKVILIICWTRIGLGRMFEARAGFY